MRTITLANWNRRNNSARFARKDARTQVLALVLGPVLASATERNRSTLTFVSRVLHQPAFLAPTDFNPHAGRAKPEFNSKEHHAEVRAAIKALLPACSWDEHFQARLLTIFAKMAPGTRQLTEEEAA